MKLIFDQPETIKRAAVELSNQGTIDDWINSTRQFKILDAFSYTFYDQAEVCKQVLINYKKLLTTTQDKEDKLNYFEQSILEVAKLQQLYQNDNKIEQNLQKNIEELFQLLGPLSTQGFERLFKEEFKYNFQLHFSTDYLFEIQNQIKVMTAHQDFLEEPKNLYEQIIKIAQDIINNQQNSRNKLVLNKDMMDHQPMPNLVYLSSNKMNKKINDSEYFKFTEEINGNFNQGKQKFLKFLIDNIEIKINGIVIDYLNQQDLELYEQDIINFFLLNDFNDSSDKEIMEFIRNKLKNL